MNEKTVIKNIKELILITLDVLNKNHDGFNHHRLASVEKATEINRMLAAEIKATTLDVYKSRPEEYEAINKSADALSILNYMEKINYSLGKINDNVNNKIKEGILFTDKAMAEMGELYVGAESILKHIHDAYITVNPVLIKHVINKTKDLWDKAQNFSTEHEIRLIQGICLPKSSLVYLLILDSLKDILWYAREIAKSIHYEE